MFLSNLVPKNIHIIVDYTKRKLFTNNNSVSFPAEFSNTEILIIQTKLTTHLITKRMI